MSFSSKNFDMTSVQPKSDELACNDQSEKELSIILWSLYLYSKLLSITDWRTSFSFFDQKIDRIVLLA